MTALLCGLFARGQMLTVPVAGSVGLLARS